MEHILKKIKANVIVSSLFGIVLGVVLVVWPGLSVQVVCMSIGAVLVIGGLAKLFSYITYRDGSLFSQMNLVMGVVITGIGCFILFRPGAIIAMVPILVGVIIIIHGVNNLQQTVSLYKSGYDKWWVALLLGLATVGFGILLVCNPFQAVDTLVMFIGVFLIYDGASDIWIISRVAYTAKRVKQELEAVDAEAEEIER